MNRTILRSCVCKQAKKIDWDEAVKATSAALQLPETTTLPYPIPSKSAPEPVTEPESEPEPKTKRGKSKRKASTSQPEPKKSKTDTDGDVAMDEKDDTDPAVEAAKKQAAIAATFFSVLDVESLKMPTMPSAEEMSKVLLDVRKRALMEEYGVA